MSLLHVVGVTIGSVVVTTGAIFVATYKETTDNGALTLAKIAIGMVQILCATGSTFKISLPWPFRDFIEILKFFSLDLLGFLDIGCVTSFTYSQKLLFAFMLAPCLLAGVMLVYIYRKSKLGAVQVRTKMIFAALFLLYPFVSQTTFQAFVCRDLGSGSWLAVDYQVSCDDDGYTLLVIFATIGVICFPLAVPIGTGGILFANREAIQRGPMDPAYSQFAFLVGDYEEQYYYWDCVEMLRKVIMTGVVSIFNRGSLFQLVIGILLSMMSLAASAWCRPYNSPIANAFKLATELSILSTLTLSMLIKFPSESLAMEGLDENIVGIFMLVETLLLPITALVFGFGYLTYEAAEVIKDSDKDEDRTTGDDNANNDDNSLNSTVDDGDEMVFKFNNPVHDSN